MAQNVTVSLYATRWVLTVKLNALTPAAPLLSVMATTRQQMFAQENVPSFQNVKAEDAPALLVRCRFRLFKLLGQS